ncbi:MAG: hypothetical protein LAP40_03525 [Acidobacteriia bacterium]|nr:hypothetical protein [Terriglobia bacterium]
MIYLIAATGFASILLMGALLVVCRGFAMQSERPEPYEVRLWVKYSGAFSSGTKKAA